MLLFLDETPEELYDLVITSVESRELSSIVNGDSGVVDLEMFPTDEFFHESLIDNSNLELGRSPMMI